MFGSFMDDRGYTLAEMLVALMIVGLALGGMTGGMIAVSRLQKQGAGHASSAERAAALANGLDQLIRGKGPFSSSGKVDLVGNRDGFRFDCAEGPWCSAELGADKSGEVLQVNTLHEVRDVRLPKRETAGFEYIGSKTTGDHWPPDNPTDWQRLKAIALVGPGGASPLASVHLWIDAASAARSDAQPTAEASP